MAFYIDKKTKIERYDNKNLAVKELTKVLSKKTNEEVEKWEVVAYYPNIELVFEHYVRKNVHDAKITQDFEHLIKQLKYVLRQYEKLAAQWRILEDQNQEIIKQNEKIIKLKQKEIDKELTLSYDNGEDESEGGERWNY